MTSGIRRVLVTGASGFLGRRLVPHLRASGRDVTAHAHSGEGDARVDLTSREEAARLIEAARPQAIVHLVGLTNVDTCEREPHEAYRLNVAAVANVVDAIHDLPNRPHLVLVSTDQVYDAPGDNREAAVVLRNTYALTKLWGERVASEIGGTVLRTNFFGRSHTPGRTSFTDWLIEQTRSGREMTLLTDVFFSPLSVETLSAAISRVLDEPEAGVFNLGSKGGMSKRDFSHAVAKRMGLKLDRARDGTQDDLTLAARRPKGMMMDSRRFETTFRLSLPTLAEEIQTAEL